METNSIVTAMEKYEEKGLGGGGGNENARGVE